MDHSLIINPKSMEHLEHTEENFCDFGFGKYFLDITSNINHGNKK